MRSWECLLVFVPFAAFVEPAAFRGFTFARGLDAAWGPGVSPDDLVVANPVVGLAGEAPVADGGVEGDCLSVVGQGPVGGGERGYDFVAAAAGASVQGRAVGDRHVQHAGLELSGDELDEAVLQLHGVSSFVMALPSRVKVEWCSCSRSR